MTEADLTKPADQARAAATEPHTLANAALLDGNPAKITSKNPSASEGLKEKSLGLRGGLKAALRDDAPIFADGDDQLIKFHGIYQGFNRDTATARKQARLEKEHEFMARIRAPGGRLTPAQYLVIDQLAEKYGGGKFRLTSRQGVQFHGLAKHKLPDVLTAIHQAVMTSFAACGDVVRNVTATPIPIQDSVHQRISDDAKLISDATLPNSRAWLEIWIKDEQGEKQAVSVENNRLVIESETNDAPESEPLYGKFYLPRKFKIGIATPADNSIDVLTNDLAILPLFEGQQLQGYNFALGGGLGMTHNRADTWPALARLVCFVEPDDLLAATRAVIALQRDYGNRSDRKRARLKYVVAARGEAWLKAELERIMGKNLAPPRDWIDPQNPKGAIGRKFIVPEYLGWHAQQPGHGQPPSESDRYFYGIATDSGRIMDKAGSGLYRSAFREIIAKFQPSIIVTPGQDIIFADLPATARPQIEKILFDHGIVRPDSLPPIMRWAMACVALPSCNLALTEAERARTPILTQIYQAMLQAGVGDQRLSVRITGCPNGCARPYSGDIGLVGRMPGYYAVFVGGDFEGTRLNSKLAERVGFDQIGHALAPLFAQFAKQSQPDEGFGDWCHRVGLPYLQNLLPDFARAEIAGKPLSQQAATA